MTEREYEDIRQQNLDVLSNMGFAVTDSLPSGPRGEEDALRPKEEIARRLWALNVVFLYVAFPPGAAATDSIKRCIDANGLAAAHTAEERAMLKPWRWLSRRRNWDSVGWYLENMLSLAWILGFEIEPGLDGAMVDEELIEQLLVGFIGDLDESMPRWLDAKSPRLESEVIAKEDLFYCAHNAVRNAQLGQASVPDGFHPIVNGGVIHERRHALTWAISPGTSWDETNLDT